MKLRSFLVLHRRMGLISAVFVFLLSLTGLLLHYSNALNLDQSFVGSDSLLDWYGIESPQVDVSYAADGILVSQIQDTIYFDQTRLNGSFSQLLGAQVTEFGYLLATRRELILLTGDGEIIEVLNQTHGIPQAIEALGHAASGALVLRNPSFTASIDVDNLRFEEIAEQNIDWSTAVATPPELALDLSREYSSALISWERLLLDLHSGQLFGWFGRLLVDVMAILFMLMAATGIWIWSRRRP